ncbi:MAG: 4-alpha-glucanotransferase [Bellilinea sp.]|nr:MAG: 4-alpha-glucanotransferase [Bellilinea sp.]
MKFERAAGIILHPTSLPGPDGIGDLGPEAYRWINFLSEAGCKLWQVLPLGPTGYGDSPYQCFSAFAGNPYLVSPALLLEDGLLRRSDLTDRPEFNPIRIDYGEAINWKLKILDRAYENFKHLKNPKLENEYHLFIQDEADWLNDFALFMAIKEAHGGVSWENWPKELRTRQPAAIELFKQNEADRIQRHAFRQFLFFRQWLDLKAYANQKNIQIIGDIPIFVAYDSADAWSNPELFYLDEEGKPTVVAGVPPDYFSPTGQLWGNPLYKWEVHRQQNFRWWIRRMQATLRLVNIVRLDHFRGFAGYWEVPYGMPTAEIGRWVKGPGKELFHAIREALGDLPIIAEDLGVITPDVVELRDSFNLPGMKVFQFAFTTDPLDPFLPHNYETNCVAYTGTHDNDTALGWYQSAPEKERDFIRRYLARSGEDISWDMIRAVWSSVAVFALAPMQDILGLGNEARMNLPGRASGNWCWRLHPEAFNPVILERLKEINYLYARSDIKRTTPTEIPPDYPL